MKKKILIIVTLLTLITGCGSDLKYQISSDSKISESNKKNKTEYIDISYDEYKKKISNKEDFVLFLYQTGCSHCLSYEPKLNKVISDYDLTIYALNLANLSEKEYAVVKNKTFVNGTPTTIFIEDGAKSESLIGDKSEEKILEFLVKIGYLEEK